MRTTTHHDHHEARTDELSDRIDEQGVERSWRSQRGASLVEYALLLALIAVVCIGALVYFGGQSNNSIGHSCHQIVVVAGGGGGC